MTPKRDSLLSQSDPNRERASRFIVCSFVLLLIPGLTSCERNSSSTSATPELVKPIDVAIIRPKADSGDAQAQTELGRAYAKGEGVKQSYTEAAKWYQKAADQGNSSAQNALGELCEAGQGGLGGDEEAAKWYQKAANQGLAAAQYNLALLCLLGKGVPKNNAEATKWYLKSAEGGNKLGQYNVGMRYYQGNGFTKDLIEAYKWLSLAAAQGVEDAAITKKALKSEMKRQEISEAENRVRNFVVRK